MLHMKTYKNIITIKTIFFYAVFKAGLFFSFKLSPHTGIITKVVQARPEVHKEEGRHHHRPQLPWQPRRPPPPSPRNQEEGPDAVGHAPQLRLPRQRKEEEAGTGRSREKGKPNQNVQSGLLYFIHNFLSFEY